MNARSIGAVVLGAVFLIVVMVVTFPAIAPVATISPSVGEAGSALWETRTGEVLIQGVIILAGVFSILLLLGSRNREEEQP